MDKTLQQFDKFLFQNNLLGWYEHHKRDLPWRQTTDPYAIWVSEVMLQQTKVDTVIPYYKRFMDRYPTIYDLAATDEQVVLKDWQGLGYYTRARNLLAAAREVVSTYEGKIPENPKELGELRGIGPYTKGAILSIAFNQPEPAVDGNVMRVLSRIFCIKDNISEQRVKKRFEQIVRDIICEKNPASFNQALMELGALICTPTSPNCMHCPVQRMCQAFQTGIQEKLPVKSRSKKQRMIPYTVLLLYDQQGNIAIEQRPNKGLLANMWQFPMIKQTKRNERSLKEMIQNNYRVKVKTKEKLGEVTHVFSHKIWKLSIVELQCFIDDHPERLSFVSQECLQTYPFSVSHVKVMDFLKK